MRTTRTADNRQLSQLVIARFAVSQFSIQYFIPFAVVVLNESSHRVAGTCYNCHVRAEDLEDLS